MGAWFGPGPLEVSMELENKIYNNWRAWALEQVELENQRGASQYTGSELDEFESIAASNDNMALEDLDPSLLESEDTSGEERSSM